MGASYKKVETKKPPMSMSAMRKMVTPKFIAPFVPHSWQIAPWRDKSPVMLLTGSAGGGKSRLIAEKCHAFALKYPGSTVLILRKNRSSMLNSTILFMNTVVIGGDARVQFWPSKTRWEYETGSVILWGGMADDEQREAIRSIGSRGGVDLAWMEEATRFTEDDYNEVRGRIRGTAAPWRQVVLTTNPDSSHHWINRRLIQGGEATVYTSSAIDNPANPREYIDTLKSLTGVLGQRLRDGLWVAAEGIVYEQFEWETHVIEPFIIPPSWRRFRVVDFGFTNPFVCQWWAMDGEGRMFRYRELYQTKRTVRDHAHLIRSLSEGENIEITVCDHDAEDRATLDQEGIPNIAAEKDISTGIQQVQQRLRLASDGRPRLFLLKGASVVTDSDLLRAGKPTNTESEFLSYAWPEDGSGRPIKEVPMKLHDHGLDALRYAVKYADRETWLLA